MNPSITAIGTANPEYRTAQERIANFMVRAHGLEGKEKNRLLALYRATGIKYRYSVLPDYGLLPDEYQFYPPNLTPFPSTASRISIYREQALPLAQAAIRDCLTDDIEIKSITHLITVSCTGLYAPGLDIELIKALDLAPTVERTCINFMGCYAAFNALKNAKAICRSTPDAKVLMVCVELCSLHFQKAPTPHYMLSNALFGDGAAAALITNTSNGQQLEIIAEQCSLVHEGSNEMNWHVGDNGFEMVLSQNVPDLINHEILELTHKLLQGQQLKLSNIDYFAIHPGGKRIISGIQRALGIKRQDCQYSSKVLKEFGNMSSPTILFVLKEIWDNLILPEHGKSILCFAFGPGLTLESMLLRINWRNEHRKKDIS